MHVVQQVEVEAVRVADGGEHVRQEPHVLLRRPHRLLRHRARDGRLVERTVLADAVDGVQSRYTALHADGPVTAVEERRELVDQLRDVRGVGVPVHGHAIQDPLFRPRRRISPFAQIVRILVGWRSRVDMPHAPQASLLLALDLTGTFAFALNGALTAIRSTHLDIVGIVALAMITALGGGILRDILLDSLPPATFSDWRYLAVAAGGGLVAFFFGQRLNRLAGPIIVLDAVGLSFFAVTGASKALDFGLGAGQAVILGALTGVGGGTLRDTLLRQIPSVLRCGLYAVPALVGAAITVAAARAGVYGLPAALGAAAACFGIRMLGVRFQLNAPSPPHTSQRPPAGGGDGGCRTQ